MKRLFIFLIYVLGYNLGTHAQTITQTIKGKVVDKVTQEELIGATVMVIGSDPLIGTSTVLDGTFILENVPVGRQSFEFRTIGYESQTVSEILVSSGKEVILNISMEQAQSELEEIRIVYEADKTRAINDLAAVSSRQFTVEETQRYAGGLNDPARLVSSFAGVASPSISSNGISVRGNSPAGLLWRVQGVEVPSPNHFADLSIAGAGLLTAMSSQVLDNSDFMTGAFPAEYGDATSGVFDMNLRSGNPTKKEHTAKIGILGLDFATEGPFKPGSDGTYLINYRYSTLALISPLLPSDAGVLKYQDLAFNLDLPTKSASKFSIWGLGAIDGVDTEVADSSEWTPDSDRYNSQTSMYMFATGLNHKVGLGSKAFLNSSLAFTGNGLSFEAQYITDLLYENPVADAQNSQYKMTLQSSISSYLSANHYNKTGFYINRLMYDMDISHADDKESPLVNTIKQDGSTMLYQFFTQSQFDLSPQLKLNAGFHSQLFELTNELTFEPRVSIDYHLNDRSSVAFSYGLHSQTESLGIYFNKDDEGIERNRNLDLMKANHWVFFYRNKLSDHVSVTIEPYYQYLTNIPVTPDSYISTINSQDNIFFNEVLVSEGTGRNIGIDFTLERYQKNGFYALFSASIFDSKYTAADGIQRNTRLNKNYVANAIVGKEWQVGRAKNNTFSANLRLNYLGGNREEAYDLQRSIEEERTVFAEVDGQLSFYNKSDDVPIYSFTLEYRKNKARSSSVWSLQVLNASQTPEYTGHFYSNENQTVEADYTGFVIPNLSYKIEF